MIVGHIGAGASQVDTGDIQKSLRFAASRSTSLSKVGFNTSATATYFAAIKRGQMGVISPIFDTNIKFNANDTLTAFGLTTTAVFRDPSAFLFLVVGNGELRINGVSFGAVTTSAITGMRIGFDGTNYFDGCMARIGVVDTAASAYTNFGYFNIEINEWVTKSQAQVKAVVDAGGANSFMLDFENGTSLTTLGYDKSSKGNNWTLNNFSLTSGANYDWMEDTPTKNCASGNPLHFVSALPAPAWSNGNTRFTGPSGIASVGFASMAIPQTGSWAWEIKPSGGVSASYAGVCSAPTYNAVADLGYGANDYAYRLDTGQKRNNNSPSSYAASVGTADTLGFVFDADARTLTAYKNGVSLGVMFSSIPSGTYIPAFDTYGGQYWDVLFGSQPLTYSYGAAKTLNTENLPDNGTVIVSGTFAGNASTDGPFVWLNGVPDTLSINSNAVTFGTHADKLANGFKVRSSSASYNAGSNTFVATITSNAANLFKWNNAQGNP